MNEFDINIDSNDDFLNLELEMDHLNKDENDKSSSLTRKCKIGEIIILLDSSFENTSSSSTKEISFQFLCKFCEITSNDLKEFFQHFELDHLKISANENDESNNFKKIYQLFNDSEDEEEILNESPPSQKEKEEEQLLSLRQQHQSTERSFSDVTGSSNYSKILPTTTTGFMKNAQNLAEQQIRTQNELSATVSASKCQKLDDYGGKGEFDLTLKTNLSHQSTGIVDFDLHSATTTTTLSGKKFFQFNGVEYQIVTEDSESELNSIIGDESDLNHNDNDILFLSDLTNLNEKSHQNDDDYLIDQNYIHDNNSLDEQQNDNYEKLENNNFLTKGSEIKLEQAEIYNNFIHHDNTNNDKTTNNDKESILFEITPPSTNSGTIDSSKDIIKSDTTDDDNKSINSIFLYHIIEQDPPYVSDYEDSDENSVVINGNDDQNSISSLQIGHQNNNFIELFKKTNNCNLKTETETPVKNNVNKEFILKNDLGKQINSKSSERILNCNLCPKVFNKISNLKSHLAYHSGQRNYPCTYEGCTRSFIQNNDRKRHIRRIHLLERNHTCDICGKKFYILSELRDHALGMHTKDKYECVRCKLKFNSKRRLQAHKCQQLNKNVFSVALLQHKNSKYNCEICIKGFSSEELLEKHFKFKHHDKI